MAYILLVYTTVLTFRLIASFMYDFTFFFQKGSFGNNCQRVKRQGHAVIYGTADVNMHVDWTEWVINATCHVQDGFMLRA